MNKKGSRFTIPALLACIFAALSIIGGTSCKKESLLQSGGEIRFSTDTVTFDTVFTSLGSATVGVKIFNTQSERISLSSIRLGKGTSSPFHLNVDGVPIAGTNVEIAGNDSIYVFATVKVDPTDENSPFFIEDRLIATLNNRDFSIPLIAYGQNAHYITDSVLKPDASGQIQWLTDKPYVIFGYAIVDTGNTLNIPARCRIYMHANARLFALGNIKAIGTKTDSIIFQGDRLDRSYFGYEGYPGEWGGIYFAEISKGNELTHVILQNGGNGAQGAPAATIQLAPGAEVNMSKTIIQNSNGYGLLSFGGTLTADNCLIHSCGASAIALVQGGEYELNNCTFAIYSNNKINHNDNPTAVIVNYFFAEQGKPPTLAPLDATLRNCVVEGSLENELVVDSISYSPSPAKVILDHCLVKADPTKTRPWVEQHDVRYTLTNGTLDPQFTDVAKGNYRPKSTSPLINSGITYPFIAVTDLDEKSRTQGAAPDLGAYEIQ